MSCYDEQFFSVKTQKIWTVFSFLSKELFRILFWQIAMDMYGVLCFMSYESIICSTATKLLELDQVKDRRHDRYSWKCDASFVSLRCRWKKLETTGYFKIIFCICFILHNRYGVHSVPLRVSVSHTKTQACSFYRAKRVLHVEVFTGKDKVQWREMCLTNKRYLFLFSISHFLWGLVLVIEFLCMQFDVNYFLSFLRSRI